MGAICDSSDLCYLANKKKIKTTENWGTVANLVFMPSILSFLDMVEETSWFSE